MAKEKTDYGRPAPGRVYGVLTVVCGPFTAPTGKRRSLCSVQCVCGKIIEIRTHELRYGKRKSCGCRSAEFIRIGNTTHGGTNLPEYGVWSGMIQRCTNPNGKAYANYGARGIVVCERWLSFSNFFADMGPRPSADHTLERIDNSLGYSEINCRWATWEEQGANKRGLRLIWLGGKQIHLAQACRVMKISSDQVSYYANRHGIDHQTAFEKVCVKRGFQWAA